MSTYEVPTAGSLTLDEQYLHGSSRLGVLRNEVRSYELTDHLGNVRSVIGELREVNNQIEVISATDYYPFGMIAKAYNSQNYRYEFNGKENDKETGSQDYGMRIYNPGLGRFLSVDPLLNEFPFYSPFQFAGNKPIWAIDLDGLEEIKVTSGFLKFYNKINKVINQSEVLKKVYYAISQKEKVKTHLVYFGVFNSKNFDAHGFTVDLVVAARFVSYYKNSADNDYKAKYKSEFQQFNSLFVENKIDPQTVINESAKGRKVYGVFLNKSALQNDELKINVFSFIHELSAHLLNDIKGLDKDESEEHATYYNYKGNPELLKKYPELLKGHASPPYQETPENSKAGIHKKEIETAIEAIDKASQDNSSNNNTNGTNSNEQKDK